jgi:hypothetical protein
MPPKKEKKPRKKVMKQKQSQKQSVVVNITAPVAPKRKRTRKVKAPEPRTGVSSIHHTFFTAPQMPPPTISQNPIPLSFYDTNRPMNMGFRFDTPVRETRFEEVDTPIIEPAIYGVEDNSEVVNNPDELTSIELPAIAEQTTTPKERIRNPLTGSLIDLGGGTHKKLMKRGILDEMGNLLRNPEKIY